MGRENIVKCSSDEIRTRREHLLITIMGKTDQTWGILIWFITKKIRVGY